MTYRKAPFAMFNISKFRKNSKLFCRIDNVFDRLIVILM